MKMIEVSIRIPALILSLFSGIFSISADTICWNGKRGFETFCPDWPEDVASKAGILENRTAKEHEFFTTIPGLTEEIDFRFKIRNHHASPAKRYGYKDEGGAKKKCRLPDWKLLLKDEEGLRYCYRVRISETEYDGISTEPCLEIEMENPYGEKTIKQFTSHYLGENLLSGFRGPDPTGVENIFRLTVQNGEICLHGGKHSSELLFRNSLPEDFAAAAVGIGLSPGGKIEINDMRLSTTRGPEPPEMSPWGDEEILENYLGETRDNMEGYWQLLDRSLEETLLKPGCDYRLAIVKATDGYDIIYLRGAKVNGSRWKRGMTKGHLSPSGIKGIWNVSWIDSKFGKISHDVKGQLTGEGTLQILFPYHDSQIRLQKTD